ncbi:long-chain N-acyl amino acid synthase [Pseudothauera nasutitermitis]|uniref:Long-chain N-acyl amino acid synthase n=1 Tax=Pseudothauera nasutitermitis TaxID=2565930 RepID=A0A4S4AUM5_9RHOO|nr:long-chain N-acyl amino acid synthase [Pseudothauera nasutitermitis]THF63667.1 long-chain N-acyl amino acid synthase [Pseudothauera nasutitermitis]
MKSIHARNRYAPASLSTFSRPSHPPPSTSPPGAFGEYFAVDCADYQILLADHSELLRARVAQLIEKLYATRGLTASHADLPARNGQTTLAACRDGTDHVFGTVTLGLDSPDGLFADELYHEQIDDVRRTGGRVCEVTRLALDPEFGSSRVLAELFHLVFILARLVHGMTDLFAEVHPRHSSYYQRMLGYRVAGPERVCPRVGAPAVLLQISLREVEQRIRLRDEERSLYRQFFPLETQWRLFEQLREYPCGLPS